METDTIVGGRSIPTGALTELIAKIQSGTGLTRTALSRWLCDRLGWIGENGRRQEVGCRVALNELERRGVIDLPAPRSAIPAGREVSVVPMEAQEAIECSLTDLGELTVVHVTSADKDLNGTWKRLMAHHYLGGGPLIGAQMRFLVNSPRGWVAALAFSAAARHVAARDEWIGWSVTARKANRKYVVCNSRFLIAPWVRVPELASKILSTCARRLAEDWKREYKYEPVLLETFVDQERFLGTCYQAANWQRLGATRGRGRQDREVTCSQSVKSIYALPLRRCWKSVLCKEPPRLPAPRVSAPADWVEEEFGGADLGDKRLSNRLVELARDFYARPQASIPQACGSLARTKAAYRWLSNPMINLQAVLQPHYEATTRRIAEQRVVLAAQDTTSFNYTGLSSADGLGPINSTVRNSALGILMHDTMAFTVEGLPLGLIDVQAWARGPEKVANKDERQNLPIRSKESGKWLRSFDATVAVQAACPETTVVSVGDREADIYELFALARSIPGGPEILVRAKHDRLMSEGNARLWDHMRGQDVIVERVVDVPRTKSGPARRATLAIRFSTVMLKPPKRARPIATIELWAVLATEIDPPADVTPLEWMLLTTLEVATADDAIEKLEWYAKRWGIEIYHKAIKSGCRVEERQLATEAGLENCLAIDLVVAWRIMHLTLLGRQDPEQPCTGFFNEHEWKAIYAFSDGPDQIPAESPPLREMTRKVAALGGFLGRKSDGDPGIKCLWLGLQRLDDIAAAWLAFGPESRARAPGTSSVARSHGSG